MCEEGNGRVAAPSPHFSLFIEEKYYFIHAISVHSSAGASLDSRSHLHTNILINGSDVSTACCWGGGGGGGERSRGPTEGIYNKVALTVVLKTFTQLYICTTAAVIQTHHTTKEKKIRQLFFLLLHVGHRLKREKEKRENEGEREREEGRRERHSLR